MYPRLIDNNRQNLKDVLSEIVASGNYEHLSIATGYWDLPGMVDIIDDLTLFKSIRLLIGQEPLPSRLQNSLSLSQNNPNALFPDQNFAYDLERAGRGEEKEVSQLRSVAKRLAELMKGGTLDVKVFRSPRLHAKAYIFGDMSSAKAVGIIGSSNFTHAGLTSNAELNWLEQDQHFVLYQPQTEQQEHGHLSWFNELWDDEEAVPWTGAFTEILEKSPVGDMAYGPYDVYIKTLMEVFPDELLPLQELSSDTSDVLYSFQNRNAGILLNKLHKMGVAMLSDSVGLGKTITAGAVIKHYREMGARRIAVITPAALKQQWRDDLGARFELDHNDFSVVSMQDTAKHERLIEEIHKPWVREVDLFVIDEAHNLRSAASTRYNKILELLETSPDAPVLLLTATPINNSLMDFANQIQLGLRGSMESVPVQYRNTQGDVQTIDFLEALKRIQSEAKKAKRDEADFDWRKYNTTLRSGLRHYLVRSTRQGVEAEGGLRKGGVQQHFPHTIVKQLPYRYANEIVVTAHEACVMAILDVFEGIDPLRLNLDVAASVTQQTLHPIDLFGPLFRGEGKPEALDVIDDEEAAMLFGENRSETLIPSVFQVINLLGYVPYRSDLYRHRYHGKTKEQIRDMGLSGEERAKISTQRTIHNILHVTWLKRFESSAAALLKSVNYYAMRLGIFEKYLDKGYIVSLSDAAELESEYGEDLERAFSDYERTMREVQEALDAGKDITCVKIEGVEKREASSQVYKLDCLRKDIARDKAIISLLQTMIETMQGSHENGKINAFAEEIKALVRSGEHGKKVLVFSFFADTIDYLRESMPALMRDIPDFEERSEFLTGSGGKTEEVARRFAPKAKKYQLKDGEREIDFLFATDVLSEGQNLQDAGLLINYDLHWNPVRMIQRNGRISRLGSTFENVLIVNIKPHEDLELYLNLVRRLEQKIDAIKNSIGTDQSVLGEEENPIEFADFYSDDTEKASEAADDILESSQVLDVFDSADEYVFELRRFLANHEDDEDMRRIKAIPTGKWNYLPEREIRLLDDSKLLTQRTLPVDTYLALDRVEGFGVVSNEPFTTTMFMKVKALGRYTASVVEEIDALAMIKASPDDNEPMRDTIPQSLNRYQVARRVDALARVRAEATASTRTISPSEQTALTAIQPYYSEDLDFQGLVRDGIRREQDNREFGKVVRLINADIKERGGVTASTQTRFITLMKKLSERASEEQRAEKIANVLFYAVKR
ncbi:MAG: helicase-related protein [Raoultibacter sp.]